MERLAQQASQLSLSSLPLLLTGETGSGKEYLARAIHQSSPQKNGTFVAINCAAIPESLIESELFGYADGAFTGARGKGKKGLIEQADGGTLFLDEIGDMPLSLQARLLRVLAESEVLPVGATKAIPVSLRVLAATHQDLSLGVQNGRFREDLFYRISGARLAIPPLRARKDIVWLATKLVEKSASKPMVLSASVQHLFNTYSWPGIFENSTTQYVLRWHSVWGVKYCRNIYRKIFKVGSQGGAWRKIAATLPVLLTIYCRHWKRVIGTFLKRREC